MRTPIRAWIGVLVIALVAIVVAVGYGKLWSERFVTQPRATAGSTAQVYVGAKQIAQRRAENLLPRAQRERAYERGWAERYQRHGFQTTVAQRQLREQRVRKMEARGLQPHLHG